MPQILVIADKPPGEDEAPVMFRERVNVTDFESPHFANQLVERIGWAVGDADEVAHRSRRFGDRGRARRRAADAPHQEQRLSRRDALPVS